MERGREVFGGIHFIGGEEIDVTSFGKYSPSPTPLARSV